MKITQDDPFFSTGLYKYLHIAARTSLQLALISAALSFSTYVKDGKGQPYIAHTHTHHSE